VGRATRQVPLVYVPVHSNSSFSVSSPSSIGSLVHIIIIISSLQGSFDDNPTRGKRWPSLTNPDLVWCDVMRWIYILRFSTQRIMCKATSRRYVVHHVSCIMYHVSWPMGCHSFQLLACCLDASQWHGSQSVFVRHAPVDVFACKPATCYWRGTLVFPVEYISLKLGRDSPSECRRLPLRVPARLYPAWPSPLLVHRPFKFAWQVQFTVHVPPTTYLLRDHLTISSSLL